MSPIKGAILAFAVANLFSAGAALAEESKGKAAATVHCGGVNECKGKGACSGADNSCKSKNSCKGKGYLELTEAQCKAKGGKVLPAQKM